MTDWHPSMGRRPASTPKRGSARRLREEAALDLLRAIRVDLWSDLGEALWTPDSVRTITLVRRIRRIGAFLGEPTAWVNVPIPWMRWYVEIETVPELDLFAETPDWDDLQDVGMHEVDDDIMALYAEPLYPPEDPDGDA